MSSLAGLAVIALAAGCGADALTLIGSPGTTAPPATTAPSRSATTLSPALASAPAWQQQFLACVRQVESGGNYAAYNPGGPAYGAYQFTQQTWNNTVQHSGMTNLYEVQPNEALPADQDAVAVALLNWQGTSPWRDGC